MSDEVVEGVVEDVGPEVEGVEIGIKDDVETAGAYSRRQSIKGLVWLLVLGVVVASPIFAVKACKGWAASRQSEQVALEMTGVAELAWTPTVSMLGGGASFSTVQVGPSSTVRVGGAVFGTPVVSVTVPSTRVPTSTPVVVVGRLLTDSLCLDGGLHYTGQVLGADFVSFGGRSEVMGGLVFAPSYGCWLPVENVELFGDGFLRLPIKVFGLAPVGATLGGEGGSRVEIPTQTPIVRVVEVPVTVVVIGPTSTSLAVVVGTWTPTPTPVPTWTPWPTWTAAPTAVPVPTLDPALVVCRLFLPFVSKGVRW